LTEHHTNDEIFEAISFHDVICTLALHLKAKERAVLQGLADGLLLREIAIQCELSYPTAFKYRQRIAGLTIKLGIASAGKSRVRWPSVSPPRCTPAEACVNESGIGRHEGLRPFSGKFLVF